MRKRIAILVVNEEEKVAMVDAALKSIGCRTWWRSRIRYRQDQLEKREGIVRA